MTMNTTQFLVTILIRTKPEPLSSGQATADSRPEADFYHSLTFSFFLFPQIHVNVSMTHQHKRESGTVISCGEEAVSQLPAIFKPGKRLNSR